MALLSRRHREVFMDQYNFIYYRTYVASNKDGDKKYWICEKRRECNVRVHTINGNIVYRSSERSHAPDTGTIAARRAVATMVHTASITESSTSNIIRNAATWTSCRAKKTHPDDRVSNIVRDYASRTFTELLRAIAHNLRF